MKISIFYVLLGFGLLASCTGFKMLSGSCPKVDPMKDLDMDKFEGVWYVNEVFEDDVACFTWEFLKENNKTWRIYERRKSGILYSTGMDSASLTTGTLTPKGTPGDFIVKWPLNILGSYDLVIFYTDYEHSAGIFACQGFGVGHREQGLILSRTPIMAQRDRSIVKGKLTKFNVEQYYFNRVKQYRCGYDGEQDVVGTNYGPLSVGDKDAEEEEDKQIGDRQPWGYIGESDY